MDSSPVDAAWDGEGADVSASDPPPSSEDHRTSLRVIADLRHPHLIVMHRGGKGSASSPTSTADVAEPAESRSRLGFFHCLRVALRILLGALRRPRGRTGRAEWKTIDFVHGEVAPSNIIVRRDGFGRLVPVLPAHWNDKPPRTQVTGYIAPERLLGTCLVSLPTSSVPNRSGKPLRANRFFATGPSMPS